MGWRFIISIMTHLNKAIEKKFEIIEMDTTSKWKKCLSDLGFNNPKNGWLHGAIGSMYARRYFGTQQKTPIKTMIKYLKNSFRNIIKETKWMSESTVATALKKLDAMKEHIAYPDELLNSMTIDTFYNGKDYD